jgi:MFS family permease
MEQAKNKRGALLVIQMIVMLIMGFVYVYSIILPYVMERFAVDKATAAIPYSVVLSVFVVGNLIGGLMQKKISTKKCLAIGYAGMIIGAGLTAILPANSYWMMSITFGVIIGLGNGIVYNVLIALGQKWWPDKRGLITGLLLAFLGVSGTILSPIVSALLIKYGYTTTFLACAGMFTVIAIIAVSALKAPPEGYMADYAAPKKAGGAAISTKQYTTGEMVKTKAYYMVTAAFMFAMPAYVLISAIFVAVGTERGIDTAMLVTGVMIASLGQVAGRFLISAISDKIGRKIALIFSFAITAAMIILLVNAQSTLYIIGFALLAFAYGGAVATFPSLVSDYFGVKHIGINYAVVMIGFGLATIFTPIMSKAVLATQRGITLSFIIAGCAAAFAILLVIILKKPKEDSVMQEETK